MTEPAHNDNATSPREILTSYMAELQMRKTPERYAILDVVMQMSGHNSAEQILSMMPEDFHVSRGSIYNTLHLLEKCGLVHAHQIDGVNLYERAYGVPPHHHYICTGCNKIWDLRCDQIEQAASKASTPKFKKFRCTTYIYGICNTCMAKLSRLKKKAEKEKEASMTNEEKRFARIGKELAAAAEWFK